MTGLLIALPIYAVLMLLVFFITRTSAFKTFYACGRALVDAGLVFFLSVFIVGYGGALLGLLFGFGSQALPAITFGTSIPLGLITGTMVFRRSRETHRRTLDQ